MLILKLNISSKSPRIELSNDTFAEWKCQVFAYKSETFHHRRPNGISHCENGEHKPQNLPSPARCGPHLIQQCLSPPHASPQTEAPTVEALLHTNAVKSPLITMAHPKCAPKSTPSRGPIPTPHHQPHPWTRPTYDAKRHPDPPLFHNALNRLTHRQTDRSSLGKFADYRPLRL